MLKKQLKLDNYLLILILIGIVFLLIYSFLAFALPVSWEAQPKLILNSPDETSNLFYAGQFANESSLQFEEQANQVADGLVTPRSMRVINGQTVPAGFLGLPIIYGLIAKIVGTCSIPFLTPIIGVIGLIFFYLLIKEIFERGVAFLATLFAFILPAFWYYSTKSMMPNVAFVSFFIIALYFLIKITSNTEARSNIHSGYASRRVLYYILFGLFLALSLMIRTSEIVWVGLLVLIVLLVNFKKIKISLLVFSLLVFVITFSPVFYFNQQIYGSPVSLGYDLSVDLEGKDIINQGLTLAEKLFLPFGFHPRLALRNLYNYTFTIFPFWTILIMISFLIFSLRFLIINHQSSFINHNNKDKTKLLYLIIFILISSYLTIYYGSWSFHDNPDLSAITIGNSYIRYWLPLYLFSLPFLSYVIVKYFKKYKAGLPLIVIYLLTVLTMSSYQAVMLDKDEGIFKVKRNLTDYQQIAATVINQTESNSIIIADTMDKVFFPARKVIFRLYNSQHYVKIRELIEAGYPVYYFYFTRTNEELVKFNQKYFEDFGLKVGESILDFEELSLYPVQIVKE